MNPCNLNSMDNPYEEEGIEEPIGDHEHPILLEKDMTPEHESINVSDHYTSIRGGGLQFNNVKHLGLKKLIPC
jgi:hypothetical protein